MAVVPGDHDFKRCWRRSNNFTPVSRMRERGERPLPAGMAVIRSTSHLLYFAGSERAVHLISAGWQAIPMFEQLTVLSASRRHARHSSVQARHVLSLSPKPCNVGGVATEFDGAGARCCAIAAVPTDNAADTNTTRPIAFIAPS